MPEMLKLKGENPNRQLLREIIEEDLPLFEMLARNSDDAANPR